MTLNYNKLKGRIVEKYGSQTNFAATVGLPVQSISRKINCKIGFSQEDVIEWSDKLEIPKSEIGEYFFTIEV